MSLFDDLPTTSILVRATLVVGLATVPVRASSAEPQAPTEAAVTLRAVEGVGSGATREEARAAAQIAVRRAILVELITALPAEVAGLSAEVAAELPDGWLGLQIERESAIEVEGGVEITLHCSYPDAAWDALVRRHSEVYTVSTMGFAEALPSGVRVVQGGSWGAVPGDRLLSWGERRLESLQALRAFAEGREGAGISWTFERAGQHVRVEGALPLREPPHSIAPTCGPCCHGHCEEDGPRHPKGSPGR